MTPDQAYENQRDAYEERRIRDRFSEIEEPEDDEPNWEEVIIIKKG
jgi:hypothetical protein